MSASARYIVQKGDTLAKISLRHYGSSFKWNEIASYNRLLNPQLIYEGQTLELPNFKASLSKSEDLFLSKDKYVVSYGDTLWKISEKTLGDSKRWPEIASLNGLKDPNFLMIGQVLALPSEAQKFSERALIIQQQPVKPESDPIQYKQKPTTSILGEGLFIVSDEMNPFRQKLVRKDAPGKVGFEPKDLNSKVTPGRHVMGDNKSKFISTSEKPFGAPRFNGKRYWIDVNTLKDGGVKFYNAAQIEADFVRIETKYYSDLNVLEKVRKGREFLKMDKEVLIEGPVPGKAVKNAAGMSFTRGTQFIQGVGIILTVREISYAAVESYQEVSVKPIAKESLKQVGGWGGAVVGRQVGFAAGVRLGFMGGTALTIETGPGVLIGAAVGAIVGGFLGSFFGDWLAGYIDEE